MFEGLTRNDPDRTLAGSIAIILLALVTASLLRFAERSTAIARARRG